MKYNPKKELTEEQLSKLSEDDFFTYLDSKAAYLKKETIPLDEYHTKRFMAMSNGGKITTEELKKAKQIGKEGEWVRNEKIAEAAKKVKVKKPDLYVKNHKTNRSQWFD